MESLKASHKLVMVMGLAIVFSFAVSTEVMAQKPQKATDKGEKVAAGQTDTNVKSQRSANDPDASEPAPEAKGGPKSKAGWGKVIIDNRTPWAIDIYVDGDYRGTVGRYGDGFVWVERGVTILYARAEFDDGSFLRWGPKNITLGAAFTWTLTK